MVKIKPAFGARPMWQGWLLLLDDPHLLSLTNAGHRNRTVLSPPEPCRRRQVRKAVGARTPPVQSLWIDFHGCYGFT